MTSGAEPTDAALDAFATPIEGNEGRMDARPPSGDVRFDVANTQLVQQPEQTEFTIERVKQEMNAGFQAINAQSKTIDAGFQAMNGRFNRLERKLDQLIKQSRR